MRVDRIELRDFGSHRHTVLEPCDARLVVIQGENGIGKTTLASEAIGHALFKDDRGSVNAGVRIGATDSAVTVEALFAGKRYRWIRRRTIRGAGKSSADLQVQEPSGVWTVVASGDKEVPAATRELLRMDAATFRTSVSLAQKDLDRFVAATAGDRKEILAAIVVDPRFKPAAALASKRALEAEHAVAGDRAQLQRTIDAIAELAPIRDVLEHQRAELQAVETNAAAAESARDQAIARIREIDAQLAATAAVAGEATRLREERDDLLERWQTESQRRTDLLASIVAAEGTVGAAGDVQAAIEELTQLRERVRVLEAAELAERNAATAVEAQRTKVRELQGPFDEAWTIWSTTRTATRDRVDRLVEQTKADTATCEACGQPIGRAQVLEQLDASRRALKRLEAAEPKQPIAIARESAALQRLESRRREAAWDPDNLNQARARLLELERTAARQEAVGAARVAIERDTAAVAETDKELVRIRARGEAIKARLTELAGQAAAAEQLQAERAAQAGAHETAERALSAATQARRDVERRIAGSESRLARLDVLEGERQASADRLAGADVRIRRLRTIAAAFGLKGLPARFIESVLPELTRNANDVLGQLFGMSIEIRAQRATADGKGIIEELDLIVRKDGVGELELKRASGGQLTAISLALAISLSRLNARRAGTAIRTLVVDEPDGLDEIRLRALGQAMRTLAHAGELERIFLITHTSTLAEYADRLYELLPGTEGPELWVDGARWVPDAGDLAAVA